MDIAATFLQEIITLVGYVLMFAAVYKLFQVATDLKEIKELLRRNAALPGVTAAPTVVQQSVSAAWQTSSEKTSGARETTVVESQSAVPVHDDAELSAEDAEATAYAQNLMRALQSESNPSAKSPASPGVTSVD